MERFFIREILYLGLRFRCLGDSVNLDLLFWVKKEMRSFAFMVTIFGIIVDWMDWRWV